MGTGNYAGFANWDVTRGSVDLIGAGLFDIYPGNGLYLDLDGSTFQGGRLESKAIFDLLPGTYELRFDIGNNRGTNTVLVNLGSVYSEGFTSSDIPPLETIVRNIVVMAPTSGRLVFDQLGGDAQGIVLDNVRLSAVPEPNGLLSMGLGLAGLAGYAGWRRGRPRRC